MSKICMVCILMVMSAIKVNSYSTEEEIRNSVDFSLDFYRNSFDVSKNAVVAPYSLRILLSALYQSSSGATLQELKEKVRYGSKSESVVAQYQALNHLTSVENIKIANKVYLKKGSVINANFNGVITDLKSAVEQVDFSQGAIVAQQMNEWVEDQTNGMIKNLVSADAVTSDVALFLINTIYFKAKWLHPFDQRSVRSGTFEGYNGQKYTIDLMNQFKSVKKAHLDSIQSEILELPYTEKSNFVFWAILPDVNSNITTVTSLLNSNIINEISQNLQEQRTLISIPKFEIESDVDGKSILQKLGLSTIFNAAELQILDNSPPLKVDKVKQKSKIIVNTDGTEASSGTYMSIVPYTIWPSFYATRPFIYMILTADTREIVFVGHFSVPQTA